MVKKFASRLSVLAPFLSVLLGCNKVNHEIIKTSYNEPLIKPADKLKVYHLGHSLVNRDMPFMLQQLAGEGHEYRSQLGWGSTLQSHWEPEVAINGFEQENAHDHYQDVREAIAAKDLDAFILTEMVEIEAAVKYFDSSKYLALFADKVSKANPATRIYFYETWHNIDDPKGWLNRLEEDLVKHWEGKILDVALTQLQGNPTIYVIPAGQALLALFKQLEETSESLSVTKIEDLFAKEEDGSQDTIHMNDVGNYFVALVHYAVVYHKSPVGLPYELTKPDGSAYDSPSPETAKFMQQVVWDVVTSYPRTGVKAAGS